MKKQCKCVKSKREPNVQCPHIALTGSDFCGVHKNCHINFVIQQKEPIKQHKEQIKQHKELMTHNIPKLFREFIDGEIKRVLERNESYQSKTPNITPKVGSTKIGEGAYGCVYYPPLKCKNMKSYNEKYKNYVMKLSNAGNSIMENEICTVIRSIPNYEEYFIPLSGEQCVISSDELNNIKCDSYDDDYSNQYVGYFMPSGGIDLHKYFEKHQVSIQYLWKIIIHLLDAIIILHNNNIIHLDIKSRNILIDKNNIPRLVDFGISEFIDTFEFPDFAGDYTRYPIFYNILQSEYMGNEQHLKEFYRGTYGDVYDTNEYYFTEGSEEAKIDESIIEYNSTTHKNYVKLIIPYLKKVDIYMLFVDILIELHVNHNIKLKLQNDNKDKYLFSMLYELIVNCTSLDRVKQFDEHQAYEFIRQNNILNLI